MCGVWNNSSDCIIVVWLCCISRAGHTVCHVSLITLSLAGPAASTEPETCALNKGRRSPPTDPAHQTHPSPCCFSLRWGWIQSVFAESLAKKKTPTGIKLQLEYRNLMKSLSIKSFVWRNRMGLFPAALTARCNRAALSFWLEKKKMPRRLT